jgi:hypothetical protein
LQLQDVDNYGNGEAFINVLPAESKPEDVTQWMPI